MRKKLITAFLCVLITALCAPGAAAMKLDGVTVSAKSAILINSQTGEVLYEKNPDDKMLIASTTKIMTAVVVLDKCGMDDIVEVSPDAANVEGSSAYLRAGEKLTVRELLYALMLSSGNDAAAALAIHVSGSIEKFAGDMNAKAKELGLENTSYKNPHGLDAEGHYSTARDLAKLTQYALKNNDFKDIVSTKTAAVGSRSLTNHNKLLWNIDGAIGVKTGYTKAAGRILVSAVERNGISYICVTLNDPDDWDDHTNIYNKVFSQIEQRTVCRAGEVLDTVSVVSGDKETVNVVYKNDVTLSVQTGTEITAEVELPQFIYAGVEKGDTAGRVTYYSGEEKLAETELVFGDTVSVDGEEKLSFFGKIKRLIRLSFKYSPSGTLNY